MAHADAHGDMLFETRSLSELNRDRELALARAAAARGDLTEVSRLIERASRYARVHSRTTLGLLRTCFGAQREREQHGKRGRR